MRNILLIAFTFITLSSYSQFKSYNDLGILFSKENNQGTARFNALSGAFGALGGDISSTNINPAGAGIAKKNSLSITLNNSKTNHKSNYYNNSTTTETNDTDISQAGALLSFDSAYNSKWNRFAIFLNYNLKTNFSNSYIADGYSNPLYDNHFSDPTTIGRFDRNLYQYITTETIGTNKTYDIGFSSAYKNKLFLGASLKIHNLEFFEVSLFEEENDDIDGNILNIENYNETYITGTGVSLNLGFIYKLNNNMRFGLAYETPTWYQEVIEEYIFDEYMGEITELEINQYLDSNLNTNPSVFEYSYKSADKITASGAYIFGKKGLISIDYTHKRYKGIKLENNNFSAVNENFNTDYRNTYSLKAGTEWRFNKLSLRGGASYEKNPNLITGGGTNRDNIKSFSLGLGYNFGNTQFDLSYTNSDNTDFYSISNANDLNINNNNSLFSGTLTFNL